MLAGTDAASTVCYALQGVQQRDVNTWGVHLLDASQHWLDSDDAVADAGWTARRGLGQRALPQ